VIRLRTSPLLFLCTALITVLVLGALVFNAATLNISFAEQAPTQSPIGAGLTSTPFLPERQEVEAAFQAFENGWLLWRGDVHRLYLLNSDQTIMVYADDVVQMTGAFEAITRIPLERFVPADRFRPLWQVIEREHLGWAVDEGHDYQAVLTKQSASGFTISLPSDVQIVLTFPLPDSSEYDGRWRALAEIPPFVPPTYPTATPTITPTPYVVEAVYQPFEQGFIVWIEDSSCVYAYVLHDPPSARDGILIDASLGNNYGYCLAIPSSIPSITPAPSEERVALGGVIGSVWKGYAFVREALGDPILPEQAYSATIPAASNSWDGAMGYRAMITLPDGRSLWCGFVGHSAGTCFLR